MNITSSIEISIQGSNVERFLNMCAHHSIPLNNVYLREDIYYASMNPVCFFSIKNLAKKSHVKVKIVSKKGWIFGLGYIKQKKILFLFPLFCLTLLWISSFFLWNVKLIGNKTLTTDIIGDYLKENGIHFGMFLKDIPIQSLKRGLMDTYPQINWTSVMIDGTSLNILLNEADTTLDSEKEKNLSKDMLAPISGVIDSIYLRNGTLMVEEGMSVEKGDLLISGEVPILIEHNNETIQNDYIADGDISIITDYPLNEILHFKHSTPFYTKRSSQKLEFIFSDNSILLPTSKVPYSCYDIYTETIEHPLLTIFSLPLQIKLHTFNEYYPIEELYSPTEAENILNEKLSQIIISLEEKGLQIIEKNVKIESNSVYSRLHGNLRLKAICNKHGISEERP